MYSEVTSKTIEYFPQCDEVCGILEFNENTDLTEIQLKENFKNIKKFIGGIRVENSELKNLSFITLSEDVKYFDFDCVTDGLVIRNNSKLTDVTILWKLNYWIDPKHIECDIRIEDNLILNVENLCYYGYLYIFIEIRTAGNLKNCGCRGNDLISLDSYQNCSLILNGFRLENTTESPFSLSNITEIRGPIFIQNTNFINLSFFKNLETIKVSNIGLKEKIMINIRNNSEMTRFGISNLKEFPNIWNGYLFINFENLHSDFCLTKEEMMIFMKSKVIFVNLHAKYCEESDDPCRFSNMRKLPKNCDYVLGDVKIESGDEKYTQKLSQVQYIFGTLSIKNTTLKDLSFLSGLTYMASLDDSLPVITIAFNKNLKEASLPSMINIITRGENYIIIHDNHPTLLYPNFELFYQIWTSKPVYFGGELGCPSDKFDILGPEFYKSCTILSGGLHLSNSTVLPDLSNIKIINGEIEISNTDLQNLSFLENVKIIETEKIMNYGDIVINIHHNPNMKKLGLKSIKKFFSSMATFTINLESLHPDFCLTTQEMTVFLDFSAEFLHLEAKFCDLEDNDICVFESLEKLNPGCKSIFGDVKIKNGDEEFINKLENVSIIFGSLLIQNTNLKDIKFLGKLRKIVNLNGIPQKILVQVKKFFSASIPIIQIIDNKNLKNIELSKIEGTISRGFPTSIIIGDDAFDSTKSCMLFQYNTRTNVSYNGGNCRAMNEVSSSHHAGITNWIKTIFMITVFFIN